MAIPSLLALGLAPPPERVWAIGDLHGDADCARHWVERTQLLSNVSAPPQEWVWTEPSSKLVFMGDFIDRGPQARDVLVFVRELTVRFPNHVTALLGNHELNLLIDRTRPSGGGRYLEYAYAAAHPAQYLAWLPADGADAGDDEVLRLLHDALLAAYQRNLHAKGVAMTPDGPNSIVQLVQPPEARGRVGTALRRWQSAYMAGVGSRTALGAWVHRPLTAFFADTVFVHGGIAEELLDLSLPPATGGPTTRSAQRLDSLAALEELNRRWLNVTRAGRVGDLAPRAGETVAQAEAAEARALAQSPLEEIASEMVEYRGLHGSYASYAAARAGASNPRPDSFVSPQNLPTELSSSAVPVTHALVVPSFVLGWDRRYKDRHVRRGTDMEQVACDRVAAVLSRLNASRIAVGHTPEDSVRIRCGGRLLALDSCLSRSFRASGNYYCDAVTERRDARICPPRKEQCEGQIVRLERADAQSPWVLHVVESDWGEERDEGAVEDNKLEL